MSRLASFRDGIRRRRQERVRQAHSLRASGARAPFIPGTEHTHLLPRGKGF
jgi:hypothetical protein